MQNVVARMLRYIFQLNITPLIWRWCW